MDKAVRYSKKRSAIYDILRSTKSHPSADWIYDQVRREHPGISLGTVYRNLAAFKAGGRVICVGVVNGQERYDANVEPHSHFVCRRCGAVLDVDEAAEHPAPDSAGSCGIVESREIVYHGVCKICSNSKA